MMQWATRKLWLAVVVSAVLTWREWVKHHPPEIILIAVLHFIVSFAVVALIAYLWGLRKRA